ncbi:MAG: hypothetical protein CME58_12675 [Halieaceae bacterium]|nr:hypothetical protein [Halieaceae bacterium]
MKRRMEVAFGCSKKARVETCQISCRKRKGEHIENDAKRVRQEECGALHRQLVEAYARIDALERRLREVEYIASLNRERNYPAYNHMVECH